jgi:hypothetical protein
MKKKLISLAGFAAALLPAIAFAQIQNNCGTPGDLNYVICRIAVLINTIIPVLIALAVVYFIWGVISYIFAKEEEAKKEGRARIIYGLIGLLVIVSIWGLVSILKSSFGVTNTENVTIPCIPTPGAPC